MSQLERVFDARWTANFFPNFLNFEIGLRFRLFFRTLALVIIMDLLVKVHKIIVFFAEVCMEVAEVSDKDASLDDALESQIRIAQVGVLHKNYYINAADDYDDRQYSLREN